MLPDSSTKASGPLKDPLVCIDLEINGLDRQNDVILQNAVLITDLERTLKGLTSIHINSAAKKTAITSRL